MPKYAGGGIALMGDMLSAEPKEVQKLFDSPNSGSAMRTQVGFTDSQRGYLRPEEFTSRTRNNPDISFPGISLESVNGALVGKIRTDVQKSIVESIRFTLDKTGCADFSMKLNALPSFPILPFSIIRINFSDTEFDWYAGVVEVPDDQGTQRDFYEFKGRGMRSYLDELIANTIYSAGLDLTEVVEDIILTWIQPYAPIKYNVSKIDGITGVPLINDIDLSTASIKDIMNTLAEMANYQWGVDGDGDFFWESIESEPVKTLFISYDVNKFDPKLNLKEVKNSVRVMRQEGKASGASGWKVGGLYNDATSISKYGEKDLDYQVPGFFEQEEIDVIGNSLLNNKKEPKFVARVTGHKLQGADDYIDRGLHRFVMPLDEYVDNYDEVDDINLWSKSGVGDSVFSMTDEKFVFGAESLKIQFTDAFNDVIQMAKTFKQGNIQRCYFYVYCNTPGQVFTFGVGRSVWNEKTVQVPISLTNIFFPVEFDIEGLSEVNYAGVQIDKEFVTGDSEVVLFIDKIDFEVQGYKTYKMNFERGQYKFSPSDQSVDIEFGIQPPKLENYLTNLLASREELRYTGEIR
jgi:hypothetical protein